MSAAVTDWCYLTRLYINLFLSNRDYDIQRNRWASKQYEASSELIMLQTELIIRYVFPVNLIFVSDRRTKTSICIYELCLKTLEKYAQGPFIG